MAETHDAFVGSEEKFKWTYQLTLSLIKLYKKNEHLWNSDSHLYQVREARSITLRSMSDELNVSVRRVARKVRSLRDIYQKYWEKEHTGAGAYPIKWPYYRELQFLAEPIRKAHLQMQKFRLQKQVEQPSPVAPIVDSGSSTSGSQASCEPFFGFPSTVDNDPDRNDRAESRGNEDDGNESDCSVYIACEDREESPMTKVEEVALVSTVTIPIDVAQKQREDELNDFFKNVNNMMKRFPPRLLAEVKLNIYQTVTQFNMQLLSESDGAFSQ